MHGTIVAGAIGAVGDNEYGVVGVNWNIRIMPVRILDNFGTGNSNDARLAIEYAIDNGADIINLSFTGYDYDSNFKDAIEAAYDAGVTVVAAVGNDDNGGINVNEEPIYPACFEGDDGENLVIGVAATTEDDGKASFSNYGIDCTDISAPGEQIFGVVYEDDEWASFDEKYRDGWSGTSLAAPFVAGVAALMKAEYPSLTPKQIRTVLQLSVDPVDTTGVESGDLGAGRLNAEKALIIASGFAVEDVQTTQSSSAATPSTNIVAAPEKGSPPTVRVFSKSGELIRGFDAYDSTFTGGVRLTMGDVDGDGVDEIVTVPGAGGGPQVRVFEQDGTLVEQFFAFENQGQFGSFVATGDVDGDGVEEIVVSEDVGGKGEVQIFELSGARIASLQPFENTSLSVRVAAGDTDGDGVDEVISGLGAGDRPLVRVHTTDGMLVDEFEAYASTYNKGIFVAAGDINSDGRDEIVTGTDNGGGPHVRIFGADAKLLGTFFAYDENFRGGVRLSVGNLSSTGNASIITAAGPGGGPHLRVFNDKGIVIGGFFTDDEADRNGINVGTWGL
jgi:hypothetical protein